MKRYTLWITALTVLAADRITKALLAGSESILIPGILRLQYVQNTGMAFGWLAGNTVVLTIFTMVLIVFALMLIRPYHVKGLAAAGVGMILGGAMGNLLDRILLGYVIDLFDFMFIRFYVFNVADAMITTGAILTGAALIFRQGDWRLK